MPRQTETSCALELHQCSTEGRQRRECLSESCGRGSGLVHAVGEVWVRRKPSKRAVGARRENPISSGFPAVKPKQGQTHTPQHRDTSCLFYPCFRLPLPAPRGTSTV